MTVQFTVTERPVSKPDDDHHTPCGEYVTDTATMREHVAGCQQCKAWLAVVRGRW